MMLCWLWSRRGMRFRRTGRRSTMLCWLGGSMSSKVAHAAVGLVDGMRCVVLEKTSARGWSWGHRRPTLAPAELMRSMTGGGGKLRKLKPRGVDVDDPACGGGTGQRWWVQDAETGEPLPYAVRESRMTVVGSMLDPVMLESVA